MMIIAFKFSYLKNFRFKPIQPKVFSDLSLSGVSFLKFKNQIIKCFHSNATSTWLNTYTNFLLFQFNLKTIINCKKYLLNQNYLINNCLSLYKHISWPNFLDMNQRKGCLIYLYIWMFYGIPKLILNWTVILFHTLFHGNHQTLFLFLRDTSIQMFKHVSALVPRRGFVLIFKGKLGGLGLQRYSTWRYKHGYTKLYSMTSKTIQANAPTWTKTGSINIVFKIFF